MENYTLVHPLTRWRLSQNPAISMVEVADRAKVDRSSLSLVERGARNRVNADANFRLAELTGIPVKDLHDWRWTAKGRAAARKVLEDAARQFRARAAAKRRKTESS